MKLIENLINHCVASSN